MIYLRDLIYTITGYEVLRVDPQANLFHRFIISNLKTALQNIQDSMIFYAKRPNDISNNTLHGTPCLEKEIVDRFNSRCSQLKAEWLSASGYPDIEINDQHGNPIGYIEVKTTARENMHSPRDFYVSPGRVNSVYSNKLPNGGISFKIIATPGNTNTKIRGDAIHVILLIKVRRLTNCNAPSGYNCWEITEFSLHDLWHLQLRTKVEFNIDYYGIIQMCPPL